MLTVGGSIRIERRYFWTPRCGGTYPIDEVIGIAAGSISAGAADFCCSMGSAQDFERAAEDLARIGGLRISKETLRQLVESAGQQVGIARASGALPPAWSADQAQVADTAKTRVYVGADGVKVRTVTQAEKDKRRHEHAVRRQQRGRSGVGNVKPLPPPRPGADEAFKEFKIGLLYDQGKIRKHMFATEGNHEVFGRLLRQHADAIELERAIEQISLTDGGPWIRNQILLHLKNLKATLLDFYHLSEHVWAAARCCLGEGQEASTGRRPDCTSSNTPDIGPCWRRSTPSPERGAVPSNARACAYSGNISPNDGRWWTILPPWHAVGTSDQDPPKPPARTSPCASKEQA